MNNLYVVNANTVFGDTKSNRSVAAFEDPVIASACVSKWNETPLRLTDSSYYINENIPVFPKDVSLFTVLNEMRSSNNDF